MRKLLSLPALLGLCYVVFLGAAGALMLRSGSADPLLALAVAGMAMTGILGMRLLSNRARETDLALTEGERYIEAVADLTQDVHAIIEVSSRSFLYMNVAVEGLLGHSQDSFLKGGLPFFNGLVHPDDLPVLGRQFNRLLETPEPRQGPGRSEPIHEQVFRIRHQQGDYRWFRSRGMVFVRSPEGHPVEILVVFQDVTQQRSFESALVQAQRAESLGALSRSTVHDLNNTLMGIQGFAEMAGEWAQDPQALHRNLDNAQASIQRATVLCRQLLAYTGQGRLQISPHQLNDAVKEALPLIESLVPEGSQLVLDLESDLPLASLDPNQARYALLNLIFNASQSLGIRGGEIAVRSQLKHVGGDPALPGLQGDYVCLEVKDSGPGKPAEVLEKIFDPLFSAQCPGYGLGLSAVQGILREHQGAVTTVSNAGFGDVTSLYFPVAEKTPEIDEGDEGTPVVGVAGVVLLVDDEPTIRAILRQGIEAAGFKVIEAVDGVDAFGAFVRHRSSISAVLLDLTMPRMGGDEVFQEIHKLAPHMPVVLMSGYSQQEATAALSSSGLAGFLPKPCSIKDAVEVLRKAIADAAQPLPE